MHGKAALFGGTLLCAGLTSAAQAGFDDLYGDYGYAIGFRPDGSYVQGYNVDLDGWTANVASDSMSISMTHSRAPSDTLWESTDVGAWGLFQIHEATQVRLRWDFGTWESGRILLTGFAAETILNEGTVTGMLSGDVTLTLPGSSIDYYYFSVHTSGGAGGGGSFGSIRVVPAPGCAGLLAVAGVASARRRR